MSLFKMGDVIISKDKKHKYILETVKEYKGLLNVCFHCAFHNDSGGCLKLRSEMLNTKATHCHNELRPKVTQYFKEVHGGL
jgi:hypothetical protein